MSIQSRSNRRRAVVVANGELPSLDPFRPLLAEADLLVAADGGARRLFAGGVRPHLVVGDMDSLPAADVAHWQASGGDLLRYPPEKDATDLELALQWALDHGAVQITILGALGGRIDHALANMLLLAAPFLDGVEATILDPQTRVAAVRNALTLHGEPGDLLSLLPVTAQVEGIATGGLAYPLHEERLSLGPSRGVSNVFTASVATVRVATGVLVAIHTWPRPRPLTW